MGGALILVSIVLTTVLWGDLSNRLMWVVLLVTLAFGIVGWVDEDLPNSLLSSRALWIAVHHLAIVIDPTHDSEGQGHEQDDPHQTVGEVAPQHRS